MRIPPAGLFVCVSVVVSTQAQVVIPARARRAGPPVTLSPSIPSPAPLGTTVTWNAAAAQPPEETLWYQFRVRAPAEDFRIVRDYGPESGLDWTAAKHEGFYEVEVSVRNLATGDTFVATELYQMASRVSGGAPVISATTNPLVFLYSAPACPASNRMRVQFQPADGSVQYTPFQPCNPARSMNFYLAGLRANTPYTVKHTVVKGSGFVDGPALRFTTPALPTTPASYAVSQPSPAPAPGGVLLQSQLFEGPVATDLSGNVVWFYPGYLSLTRPEPGGLFLGFLQDPALDPSHQILREFDLAGTTIRETNAARVSEQLADLGMRPITAFHHEARALPEGKILALANTEQILTEVQGPEPVNVLGDMILVLDRDLHVVWAWDAFDHLDPHRMATLRETCTPTGGGCPPFYLTPRANDWLHGNSLQLTPDGNILFSIRHQDWVVKIDYNNGAGSGEILWRLGKDGDFQPDSPDPYPWFSHQHDPQFESEDASTLVLFDNGNVRRSEDSSANSRGQAFRLDETRRVATAVLNADLGGYSPALGSSQKLPNGNYHFDLGILPGSTSRSVEVDSSGRIVYAIQVATPQYRTFRMADLYTP